MPTSILDSHTNLGRATRRTIGKYVERARSLPSEAVLRALYHPLLARMRPCEEVTEKPSPARRGQLDSFNAAVVAKLDRDGLYTTSLSELGLPSSLAMFADAKALSGSLAERSRQWDSAGRAILTATADDFLAMPSLFHWGLNSRLLDIAEAYLGSTCAYDGPAFYYSRADGVEVSTRKWHRDREDRRMVKVAIYINDVCEASGPLEVLTFDAQQRLDGKLAWPYQAVTQAQLRQMLGAAPIESLATTIMGQQGTVTFVDTARFHHRGKPPIARDRSAIFYSYFPSFPRHPFYCRRSTLDRQQLRHLIGDLPQRQKNCVEWRDHLPITSRLIPLNRMTV